jgi:hypothetical protein
LAAVREILVMGHSVKEVDHAYFLGVIRKLDGHDVRRRISYYDDNARAELRRDIEHLGIPEQSTEFVRLADM